MKTRVLTAAIVLFTGVAALAAPMVSRTFNSDQTFALDANGTFILDNPSGNVTITVKDTPGVEAMIFKRVDGTDLEAVEEGRRLTQLMIGGNEKTRTLRMTIVPGATKEWQASVAWNIRVPRGASVKVITTSGDHIRISGVRGVVQAKNFNGQIVLEDVIGPAVAESVNGSIFFVAPSLRGNVLLTSVNGDITATVPRAAGFRWVAETVKGDIRTHFPARGAFINNTFTGTVNAPGGPTLRTLSLMGNVQVFAGGVPVRLAQSVRRAQPTPMPVMRVGAPQQQRIVGDFTFRTTLGDVRVQEVTGKVDIFTGAGEVQIGSTGGAAKVHSRGGPLQFGEIGGPIDASTRAGDVLVDSARRGGAIQTNGGTIRLLYTSGPTRLYSGGGDIHVRQAAAPVEATTESGDIAIAVDATLKSQKVDAKTSQGNIILNVSPQFGADLEATVLTSDPNADQILSDIPGLSISREQVGGQTRIHATGKLNGGGEKIVLQATDGDIRISTGPVPPTVVTRR
ncbi:MAG TPA: DUF4097 family beta strand repeat-containing protein [Thermoanaerobaculia bacterium]|nr:DUF4097 family beta strand repeat-containing protein [Thermoanaerobaculia bacterium]